jgi:hypothetical protein
LPSRCPAQKNEPDWGFQRRWLVLAQALVGHSKLAISELAISSLLQR